MPPSGQNTMRKSYPKNSGKHIFGYIIYGENFLRENFSPQYPLGSPRGSQISLNATIGPQHNEKKLSKKLQENYFRIYNFWGIFLRVKIFHAQYPLASPRGSQISLNAPIGPQHDEKKLSEKFWKKYFRIYNLWSKFFA